MLRGWDSKVGFANAMSCLFVVVLGTRVVVIVLEIVLMMELTLVSTSVAVTVGV